MRAYAMTLPKPNSHPLFISKSARQKKPLDSALASDSVLDAPPAATNVRLRTRGIDGLSDLLRISRDRRR